MGWVTLGWGAVGVALVLDWVMFGGLGVVWTMLGWVMLGGGGVGLGNAWGSALGWATLGIVPNL